MNELIAIEAPAKSFFWTAPVSDTGELTTEDPLGLDYVAQQIGLMLLPTLTTRSTRAQAFAMVLYGLNLAERAIAEYSYPNTDEQKRELFERWERLWALATLESLDGRLPRGDWDTMRGVRGAKAAWRPGDGKLPLEFALISRQQELGNLGAYLAPLRRSRLVPNGGLKPEPSADAILENFWDDPAENKHVSRYSDYAMHALKPGMKSVERKVANLTLKKLGERSRLTSISRPARPEQQKRLYKALFADAKDSTTYPIVGIVESASNAGVTAPRDILDGAIGGSFGVVDAALQELLSTARAFGDYMAAVLVAFDRVYDVLDRGGWVMPHAEVVAGAFSSASVRALGNAAAGVLDAPCVEAVRALPMHGRACLRLAEELREATPQSALQSILGYHASVQRDRRRGGGWIQEAVGKLQLGVTAYTARPDAVRFPSYKLTAVRTLLIDTGRLPFDGAQLVEQVGA